MNQNQRLLAALANGRRVTRLNAMFDLQIQNVTARVTELRDRLEARGLEDVIFTDEKTSESGARYAEYSVNRMDVEILRGLGILKGSPGHFVAVI